jgi:hypothetical protein
LQALIRASEQLCSGATNRFSTQVIRAVRVTLWCTAVSAFVACSSSTAPGSAWWQSQGSSACATPALYRVNKGPVHGLGDCAGHLLVPPATVKLRVGDDIDVHIIQNAPVAPGSSPIPMVPIPSSSDSTVLKVASVADYGATETLHALRPGTASLMTLGDCMDTSTYQVTSGPCPVLQITVVS